MSREVERKRLIELLYQFKNLGNADLDESELADYLLENGVIVPPCKVGDVVYRIVKMRTGLTTEIRAIRKEGKITGVIKPCEPTIKQFIRSVTVTKNNFIDCCENFGKTVFFSEAEAEYALKNKRSVSLVNGHIEE